MPPLPPNAGDPDKTVPSPDPDKTAPIPGPAPAEIAVPVRDLVSLAALKGLLDEPAARATLAGHEATVANLAAHDILGESFARELLAECADTLCAKCGRALVDHGCPACSGRRLPPEPPEAPEAPEAAEAPEPAEPPLKRLGKYRLADKLGEGGMGTVWKAHDEALDRWVAIKLLKGHEPEDLMRFVREAQTAAKINHPNVVPVHEAGVQDAQHFIAMEFIEGSDLKKLRLEPRRAVELIRDAAKAVHHAHQMGIIHRDLKPHNLLLSNAGHLYVTDFGLAKQTRVKSELSRSGMVMGSAPYMPPEQAQGHVNLDARADVYGLGATLYDLLTGRPPHEGENVYEILRHVVEEEPVAPRVLNPRVGRDIEIMVQKALAKEKARRYATADEFAKDLGRYLKGDPIAARPATWTYRASRKIRRNPWAWAASGVAAIVLLGVAGYFGYAALLRAQERAERTAAIAGHKRDAETALSARQWERAGAAAARGLKLAPDDRALSDAARLADQMKRAEEALARAEAIERENPAEPVVPDWAPASERELAWEHKAGVERRTREIDEKELEAVAACQVALSVEETFAPARDLLTQAALRRWEHARAKGESAEADRWREVVMEYGGPQDRARFTPAPVRLGLTTEPAGAEAYLFRYVEHKRRLVPVPVGGEAPVWPSVDAVPVDANADAARAAREGTAYPLAASDANRVTFPLDLAPGSYLVLFRREGHAETRYPVLLEDAPWEARVRLPRAEDVPPGFVYVPGGPYIAGNDPDAEDYTGAKREGGRREVGAFYIQKFSVTAAEYLAFLNDRSEHSVEEAMARAPRRVAGGEPYWTREPNSDRIAIRIWREDEAVGAISWHDAKAYAGWYTKRHGENRWVFRLPTEDEWEKAARGVEGRYFAWGNFFDPSFCGMHDSREPVERSRPQLERVGFFPADESVYGARDFAGVIRNWTATETTTGSYVVKGGSWGTPALWCRAATRGDTDAALVGALIGVRLVAVEGSDF